MNIKKYFSFQSISQKSVDELKDQQRIKFDEIQALKTRRTQMEARREEKIKSIEETKIQIRDNDLESKDGEYKVGQ